MTEPLKIEVRPPDIFGIIEGKKVSHVGVYPVDLQWGYKTFVKAVAIGGVETKKDYRGRGLASRLVKKAIEWSKSQGYNVSTVSTSLKNIARRLYSSQGYVHLFPLISLRKSLKPKKSESKKISGIEIRPFERNDIEGIIETFNSCFNSYFGPCRKDSSRWLKCREKTLRKDEESIIVALDEKGLRGYAGYFEHWSTVVSEICVKPGPRREILGRVLLSKLEEHMATLGMREAIFWPSPMDDFHYHLLLCSGYRKGPLRTFMLRIVNLPSLISELSHLFRMRLIGAHPPMDPYVIYIKAPTHAACLTIKDGSIGISAEPYEKPNVTIKLTYSALHLMLTGIIGFFEAYLLGKLNVKPPLKDEVREFLDKLFPEVVWYHPVDDWI